jgi:hypothetical protein
MSSGPVDGTPARLALVRLGAPDRLDDLGFFGTFIGPVPA